MIPNGTPQLTGELWWFGSVSTIEIYALRALFMKRDQDPRLPGLLMRVLLFMHINTLGKSVEIASNFYSSRIRTGGADR